jgi:hypothetical protein
MYELATNIGEHAEAIVRDGVWILHLNPGTVRNEQYAQLVVDVLNAAEAVIENPAYSGICDEDVTLEQAVKKLRQNPC